MSLSTSVHLHLDTGLRQQRRISRTQVWRQLRVSSSLWLGAYALFAGALKSCQHQHGPETWLFDLFICTISVLSTEARGSWPHGGLILV